MNDNVNKKVLAASGITAIIFAVCLICGSALVNQTVQTVYTKDGEDSDTVHQGRTGNFALDGYHNYKFVNGLLVDVW